MTPPPTSPHLSITSDHFFGSTDTHVDRSAFQHFLDADCLSILPHLKPSIIFVITVQRCNPDADIDEDEDDVKVQSQNVPRCASWYTRSSVVGRLSLPPLLTAVTASYSIR